jgi:uncharacterized Rmd1/YagE family protein
VFVFAYGVVVFWGFSVADELQFLRDIKPSETDPLAEPESDGLWEYIVLYLFHINL